MFRSVIITVVCLCLFGCKQESQDAKKKSDPGNPLNAPVDYVGALNKAQKSAQKTVVTTGLDQALKGFFAQEGRFPTNLNELSAEGFTIPAPPAGMQYKYDPTTGTISVVPK